MPSMGTCGQSQAQVAAGWPQRGDTKGDASGSPGTAVGPRHCGQSAPAEAHCCPVPFAQLGQEQDGDRTGSACGSPPAAQGSWLGSWGWYRGGMGTGTGWDGDGMGQRDQPESASWVLWAGGGGGAGAGTGLVWAAHPPSAACTAPTVGLCGQSSALLPSSMALPGSPPGEEGTAHGGPALPTRPGMAAVSGCCCPAPGG